MLGIMLTWAVPIGIAAIIGFFLFLFRKKIAGGFNKAAQFFARHKMIRILFTIILIAGAITGGIFFGWWLANRPISAPQVTEPKKETPMEEEKEEVVIIEISPAILQHDYREKILSVLGSGLWEFDRVWLQKNKKRWPDFNQELKDVVFLEKSEKEKKQCLLATLSHLKPGEYNVLIKRWGKEVAEKENGLVVLKNPYGFPKPSRWLLLFVFMFVVGILFWAFWGLTTKKKTNAITKKGEKS